VPQAKSVLQRSVSAAVCRALFRLPACARHLPRPVASYEGGALSAAGRAKTGHMSPFSKKIIFMKKVNNFLKIHAKNSYSMYVHKLIQQRKA
jgi:hypothetical protein